MNERGLVEEPNRCGQCSKKYTQRLLHNRSSFYDKQILKMQVGISAKNSSGCTLVVLRGWQACRT